LCRPLGALKGSGSQAQGETLSQRIKKFNQALKGGAVCETPSREGGFMAQSLSRVLVQFVFSTKERFPFLVDF
jgi:hypothetical protein